MAEEQGARPIHAQASPRGFGNGCCACCWHGHQAAAAAPAMHPERAASMHAGQAPACQQLRKLAQAQPIPQVCGQVGDCGRQMEGRKSRAEARPGPPGSVARPVVPALCREPLLGDNQLPPLCPSTSSKQPPPCAPAGFPNRWFPPFIISPFKIPHPFPPPSPPPFPAPTYKVQLPARILLVSQPVTEAAQRPRQVTLPRQPRLQELQHHLERPGAGAALLIQSRNNDTIEHIILAAFGLASESMPPVKWSRHPPGKRPSAWSLDGRAGGRQAGGRAPPARGPTAPPAAARASGRALPAQPGHWGGMLLHGGQMHCVGGQAHRTATPQRASNAGAASRFLSRLKSLSLAPARPNQPHTQ
jgi:hypothetical protein